MNAPFVSEAAPAVRVRPLGSSPVRKAVISVHKWLGLAAAALWMLQAITGVLLTFHWEISDAAISLHSPPRDLEAIERRVQTLPQAGEGVMWVWSSAGLSDRFVAVIGDGTRGGARQVRLDGAGTELARSDTLTGGFFGTVLALHENLLAGPAGGWIIGISGVLLLTNIAGGIWIGWARRGYWKQALTLARRGPRPARIYSWHRAIGLWIAVPSLVLVATGTILIFDTAFRSALGVPEIELAPVAPQGEPIGFAQAVRAAEAAIPGSRFVGTTFPTAADASYEAWVRAPGELYREGGYAGSLVVIDANDGHVRGAWPLPEQGAAYQVAGALYPLHTGEAGGLVGRLLSLAASIGLGVSIVIGCWLYLARRRKRR